MKANLFSALGFVLALLLVACAGPSAAGEAASTALSAPTITVSGAGMTRQVSVKGPAGAQLFYTTDGSVPTPESPNYHGALTLAGRGLNATVQVVAQDGDRLSAVSSREVTIEGSAPTLGALTTFAGTGSAGRTDGAASSAQFNYPEGLATDGTSLFVADASNDLIRKIDLATGEVTTLAGSSGGWSDAVGTAARFNGPAGIATDGTNLYVAERYNHVIRKVVIATGEVTTLAGNGSRGWENGVGLAAQFSYPMGVATDGVNVYVADSDNKVIRKIVLATREVSNLAGGNGQFFSPQDLVTDGTYVYVADSSSGVISKVQIATGSVVSGLGGDAGISSASGLGFDGTNLYVGNLTNGKLTVLGIATGTVFTPAFTFSNPNAIVTDGLSLYVADSEGHQILRIQ